MLLVYLIVVGVLIAQIHAETGGTGSSSSQSGAQTGGSSASFRQSSLLYKYDIRQAHLVLNNPSTTPRPWVELHQDMVTPRSSMSGGQQHKRSDSILYDYDNETAVKRRMEEGRPRQLIATVWEPSAADFDPSIQCPICIDEFGTDSNAIKLPKCGHSFHEDCLLELVEAKFDRKLETVCPVCRQSFQA